MKKLLVILLLLFPVHGAWAENFPKGFFGIKFGDKFNKENLDPYVYELKRKFTGEGFVEDDQIIYVKPPQPNKIFDEYGISVTPISKRIFSIYGLSRDKMTLEECKERVAEVTLKLEKKYKKLPPFRLGQYLMNRDKTIEWAATTITMDMLYNPGKKNYFNVPLEITQTCKFNTNTYQHVFISENKKLEKLYASEEEQLKNQGF